MTREFVEKQASRSLPHTMTYSLGWTQALASFTRLLEASNLLSGEVPSQAASGGKGSFPGTVGMRQMSRVPVLLQPGLLSPPEPLSALLHPCSPSIPGDPNEDEPPGFLLPQPSSPGGSSPCG